MLLLLLLTFVFPQLPGGACGCEDKPQVQTLAVVNGTRITKQQLGIEAQNRVSTLQNEVIKAREAELDRQINAYLLEAEAGRRGISSKQLLQLDVIDKVEDPKDEEIKAFYEARKEAIQGSLKSVRPQIMAMIRAEREREAAASFTFKLRSTAVIKLFVPMATAPANEEELDRVLAIVNQHRITSRDIEQALQPLIYRVQQHVYTIRKEDLEMKVNDLLLEAEAKRLNTTAAALLARQDSRLPIITDAQAKAFYNLNKDKINDSYDNVKFQIFKHLFEAERLKLSREYAAELRKSAAVQIYLTPPDSPVFKIPTDNQPFKGNASSPVTLIMFTDFECDTCARDFLSFERLASEFGAQVKFVIRDYPLAQNKNAAKVAEAAEAARTQGKYWEFVSLVFASNSNLNVDRLKQIATQVGLNRVQFDQALASGVYAGQVQLDFEEGVRLGLDSAPAYFLNGKRVWDYNYDGLKGQIQAALKRAGN